MKLKRNYKKCLSTAILLCLMASSAYAMPTGGNVVMGNVTNVNNPAAIMAANAHSIIDWNKFNIAANEKVTFNTNTFTVLNRVQGGYESQILGVLQDQGKGHLILMNPSGIVLGENSVIDANKLTLTSLPMDKNQFKNLINGNNVALSLEDKYEQPSAVKIDLNSKITVNEALNIFGGKINIADGVEIVSKDYGKAGVNIFAVNGFGVEMNDSNFTDGATTYHYDDNVVKIGKINIGNDKSPVAKIDIRGGIADIDGLVSISDNKSSDVKQNVMMISGNDLTVSNSLLENYSGDVDIIASGSWKAKDYWNVFTAYPAINDNVTVKNTTIKTSNHDIAILGANVDISGANISSGKNLIVGAVKEYSNVEGITTAKTYDTSTVNVDDNTQIDVVGTSTVYGAIVNVDWKKFDQTVATTNPLVMWQGRNDISNEEIIEQAKNLKDKKEMQRIINMLQDAGGNDALPKDTNVIAKPVVPSYEDTKNKGDVVVLTGEVTQEYISSLQDKLALEENTGTKGDGIKLPDSDGSKQNNKEVNQDKKFFESMSWADSVPDKSQVYVLENNEQYNFAKKLDGNMTIKNLKTDSVKGGGTIVKFDVYNGESVPGVVEVFDANGNRIKTIWIEPDKTHSESAGEAITDIGKIFTGELNAKKTSIDEVEVPKGGGFRITNNAKDSQSLKLYGLVNETMDLTGEIIQLICNGLPGVPKEQVRTALVEVVSDAVLEEISGSVSENGIKAGINKVIDKFVNGEQHNGENLFFTAMLENVKENLNAKGVLTAGVQTGVNVVSAVGKATKPIQEVLFLMNKALNKVETGFSLKKTEHAKATYFVVKH